VDPSMKSNGEIGVEDGESQKLRTGQGNNTHTTHYLPVEVPFLLSPMSFQLNEFFVFSFSFSSLSNIG